LRGSLRGSSGGRRVATEAWMSSPNVADEDRGGRCDHRPGPFLDRVSLFQIRSGADVPKSHSAIFSGGLGRAAYPVGAQRADAALCSDRTRPGETPTLRAGLLTPPEFRPMVCRRSPRRMGGLRSCKRRGRETRAERIQIVPVKTVRMKLRGHKQTGFQDSPREILLLREKSDRFYDSN
jgi:hypothetical protein